MEWLPYVHDAIEYIEKNLLLIKDIKEVGNHLHISIIQLQKGFHVLTGYTIYEYIRSRRLYEAALEILDGTENILDIALKYGYETHESFTKAFTKFHGVNPKMLREHRTPIKKFNSIKLNLVIDGGPSEKIKIRKKYPFILIGYKYKVTENLCEIQKFWDEIYEKHYSGIKKNGKKSETASFIERNRIGEYGVLHKESNGELTYIIAGRYSGEYVPEGMEKIELAESEWAIIDYDIPCFGGSHILDYETRKTRIEELADYEYDNTLLIEWYESIDNDKNIQGYRSALWIPVKKKDIKKGGEKIKRFKTIFECIYILAVLSIMTLVLFVWSGKNDTSMLEDIEPRSEISMEEALKNELYGRLLPQKILDGYIIENTPGIYGSGENKVFLVKYYNSVKEDEMIIKTSSKTWFLKHEPESIETNIVKYHYTLSGVSSYIYFEKDDVIISYTFSNRDINKIDNFYDMVNSSKIMTGKNTISEHDLENTPSVSKIDEIEKQTLIINTQEEDANMKYMWEAYADIVKKYYDAQNDYEKDGEIPIGDYNDLYFQKASDQVFLVHDINSDRVPELFIGRCYSRDYIIYDAYTWVDEKATRFLENIDIGYRNGTCDIRENGIILSFFSGSAWTYGFDVFKLPSHGSKVKKTESFFALGSDDPFNQYSEFYKKNVDDESLTKISESEYIEYRDSFKKPEINFIEINNDTIKELRQGVINTKLIKE